MKGYHPPAGEQVRRALQLFHPGRRPGPRVRDGQGFPACQRPRFGPRV
ncbi:hypothetical protein MBEBAB_0355 [Brevundimonas abyssalis TAR-001]|uniref:Uncharacterized protein n=1 Tax=Brevundimonas abyssalis TAR-001 TaxID=1391729 RepID=A0A8E0KJQ5_9CAUL|nr:hypothetical protein MBEBAB_0355 [Brevundimonas abyssalis TAR-001]